MSLASKTENPPETGAARRVAAFEVFYRRYLDENGEPCAELPGFASDPAALVPLYRTMVLTRVFDEKAIALQRTGRLGTYASALGEEAVGVGVASAMQPDDVLLPSFREQAAQIWRGAKLTELLLYWGGDERGSAYEGPAQDFPICVPVGTQFPHGCGVALAFKRRGEARAAVCVGGDGATSKGDFYEAINIAGVWRLPVVFVIANNQWAISVPRSAQSAAETLAQKAIAAGMPGEQVDGNDIVAVREASERALARARAGEGPTLIEALTYRLADHTTADDARRYREDTEVSARWKAEPVARLRNFLVARAVWTKEDEEGLRTACTKEVEEAVEAYLNASPAPPTAMFDHLFQKLPHALAAQRRALAAGPEDGDA